MTTNCVLSSAFPLGTFYAALARLFMFPRFHLYQGFIRQENTAGKCTIFATQEALQPAALVRCYSSPVCLRRVKEVDKSNVAAFSANVMSICLYANLKKVGCVFIRRIRTGCQQCKAQAEQDTAALVSTASSCEICSKESQSYKMSLGCYQPVTLAS